MSELNLLAKKRTVLGKKVKTLRNSGILPAVLYGINTKTQPIQLDCKQFEKIYEQAGESSLVDLSVDKLAPVKVIIQSVERNPLNDELEHADLYQVDLTKKITTEISLSFWGESPAIKELNGVLVRSLDKITVECLPQYLVHEIKVDISGLKTFEDIIHVKDLNIPSGIEVKENPDEPVALVSPPRSDEELEKLNEEVEEKVEDVEVVKEKKAEAEAEEEVVTPETEKEKKEE